MAIQRLRRWLTERPVDFIAGPEVPGTHVSNDDTRRPWWQVMCLTGVDYFSTLGYLPAIAVVVAGSVAPLAVVLVVLLTLLGMVPIYARVAAASPDGKGSIAMLERVLDFWRGKLLVLVLLGFVATAWFMTITLSASDAAAHVVGNPYVPDVIHHPVLITIAFVLALGIVFLRGFTEAIGIAVVLVAAFLACTVVIIVRAAWELIVREPGAVERWRDALTVDHGTTGSVLLAALLAFPPLALGLSGFETGVAMMPLIRAEGTGEQERVRTLVANTRRMLLVAALIMSVLLITTTAAATLLVDPALLEPGGVAEGRALSWLAHDLLGATFGTVYDVVTIAILWFAGASALAGLLNVVPRYLPRYGMAPGWTLLMRPLVLLNIAVVIAIVIGFQASVEAQAGAYATGVLAMMLSASVAVALHAARARRTGAMMLGIVTSLILSYALVANEVARPDGVIITIAFILGIVVGSLTSRVMRSTELRSERIELDDSAREFLAAAVRAGRGEVTIIAHRPRPGSGASAYAEKEREQRLIHHIGRRERPIFLEMAVDDASVFSSVLTIEGHQVGPHRILAGHSSTVPNAIAALLLHIQAEYGVRAHCYFGWTEGNPVSYLIRYVLFGEGDTAPVTREVIRQAVRDPHARPSIHVGG